MCSLQVRRAHPQLSPRQGHGGIRVDLRLITPERDDPLRFRRLLGGDGVLLASQRKLCSNILRGGLIVNDGTAWAATGVGLGSGGGICGVRLMRVDCTLLSAPSAEVGSLLRASGFSLRFVSSSIGSGSSSIVCRARGVSAMINRSGRGERLPKAVQELVNVPEIRNLGFFLSCNLSHVMCNLAL